jgi:hypothetical protein
LLHTLPGLNSVTMSGLNRRASARLWHKEVLG